MHLQKSTRLNFKNRKLFCDPTMCDECLYIGIGDFICGIHQKIVVADWQPTEDYQCCRKRKRRKNK